MKPISLACGALLCLLASATPAAADTPFRVDPSVNYGVWQGWGTSLAWWANVVGGFPSAARQDYMAKAFDPVRGLGLNVARYNIGGGENPDDLPPHKSALEYRARVPGFEDAFGRWNWSADANQRWVLRRAISLGVNRTEAFSNSPPYWITISGSVTGGSGGGDNLAPGNDAKFGDYLATVVKHFRDDWGVTFGTVEPLNEPSETGWAFGSRQEGCHFSRERQSEVIETLAASLKRAGVTKTGIAASDENDVNDGWGTFRSFDPETVGDISQINVHGYGGATAIAQRLPLSQLASGAGKRVWTSEYGDGDASGLTLSREILTDLHYLHPSAWVYWQFVDGPQWGLLVNPLQDETTTGYTINPKYYVLGQYSRYIRPGYAMIGIDDGNSVAAYDARSRTLVIVTTNDGKADAPVSFDLSRFQSIGADAAVVRTSANERWHHLANRPISGGLLRDVAPVGSVTTYVIRNTIYRLSK